MILDRVSVPAQLFPVCFWRTWQDRRRLIGVTNPLRCSRKSTNHDAKRDADGSFVLLDQRCSLYLVGETMADAGVISKQFSLHLRIKKRVLRRGYSDVFNWKNPKAYKD